jgi:hypothetical protein
MPLQKTIVDPFDDTPIEGAYVYCSFLALDFFGKSGKLVMAAHPDVASAYSGKPPITTYDFAITPNGTAATYGPPPVLTPEHTVEHAATETEEAWTEVVPATYGDAPLIAAAIPSFDELMMANYQAFGMIAQAVEAFALLHPVLADATPYSEV